jgi:hypothetical protein
MNSPCPLTHTRKGLRLLVVMGILTIDAVGCEDRPTEPDLNPDFMVGDWLAESLVLTSVANPEVTADLVALGAVFTLLVQPPGRYTAILEGLGLSSSTSGTLTVDDAFVVFMQELPITDESMDRWERSDESVILVGESEFDFNLDGTTEPATLRRVVITN